MEATELDFPVRSTWLLKPLAYYIPSFLILPLFVLQARDAKTGDDDPRVVLAIFLGIISIGAAFNVLTAYLRKATFHFSIDDQFLTVRQGIFKKMEKHVPYGVIQHILVKQGFIDRLFGLSTLAVENATRGKDNEDGTQRVFGIKVTVTEAQRQRGKKIESIGFHGNRLTIPGLLKKDAAALREIILQKMKENPLDDARSGL
jgi:uncharacterized membrane protein YdbT with pleckstrin-like domain